MAASFSSIGKDALSVVARQLGTTDLVRSLGINRTFDAVVRRAPNYLALQRLQWSQFLGSLWTDNFNANEAILREFGLQTVEFTAAEEEAWRAAWSSLETPPAPLSEGEQTALAAKWLPEYTRYMPVPIPEHVLEEGEEEDLPFEQRSAAYQAYFYRQALMAVVQGEDEAFDFNEDGLQNGPIQFVPPNLTSVALQEAPFEGVLRIFAVDGNRHSFRDLHRRPLTSMALARHVGTNADYGFFGGQSGTPRSALLLVLMFMAELKRDGLGMGAEYFTCSPLPIQLLSMHGFDFVAALDDFDGPAAAVKRFLTNSARSLNYEQDHTPEKLLLSARLIFDRLFVQEPAAALRWRDVISLILDDFITASNSTYGWKKVHSPRVISAALELLAAIQNFAENIRDRGADDGGMGKRVEQLTQEFRALA